jgi:hypothetical protein
MKPAYRAGFMTFKRREPSSIFRRVPHLGTNLASSLWVCARGPEKALPRRRRAVETTRFIWRI